MKRGPGSASRCPFKSETATGEIERARSQRMIDNEMMVHGEDFGISQLVVCQVGSSMATIEWRGEGGLVLALSLSYWSFSTINCFPSHAITSILIVYAVAELDKTAMAIDRQSLMLCEFTSDPFVPPARQNLEIFLKCFQSQGDYTLHCRV